MAAALQLRDYQCDLLDRVQDELRNRTVGGERIRGARSVCMVAPTGAGKTVMFVHMCAGLLARGKRVYILVHRAELLKQACKALQRQGVPHGVIWKDQPMSPALVQVCSVNTMVKRLDRIPAPDFLIIDECHHGPAGMWLQIIEWLPPHCKIIGVTATPRRLDGKPLTIFERLVIGPSVSSLIEQGYLCDYVLYQPDLGVDLSKVHTKFGDYVVKELNELLNTPKIIGDCVEHYKKYCPNAPSVAFCINLDHAENVADRFRKEGVPAISIDGTLSENERAARLDALANGTIQVLTSCMLINEGFDLPRVTGAILMRPTMSEAMYLQQVGRALRPDPSKEHAVIIDHVGNSIRHFLPDDERKWSLEGTIKRKRGDEMEPEERAIRLRRCPECYCQFRPRPECPACGYVFQTNLNGVEEVAGQLKLVKPTRKEIKLEQQKQKFAAMTTEQRERLKSARTYEEVSAIAAECGFDQAWVKETTRVKNIWNLAYLKAEAVKMGYKPGWAEHVYYGAEAMKRGKKSDG